MNLNYLFVVYWYHLTENNGGLYSLIIKCYLFKYRKLSYKALYIYDILVS